MPKKFLYSLGSALLLLILAGSAVLLQKQTRHRLRARAESTFYDMKSLEIQIGQQEHAAPPNAEPGQASELQAKRDQVRKLKTAYGNALKELDIYAKVSAEDRAIMRVAGQFGECEVNLPRGFAGRVKQQIAQWKSSDRLQTALTRARQKGYPSLIARILKGKGLPPQFFYLALLESNFHERAVGSATPLGCAKGLWQFLASTAKNFGLQMGPWQDRPVYDPRDERFDPDKSTVAAAKYLRDISDTDAQGSGLLVMAVYNAGGSKVLNAIHQMPPSPRERNFWRLLASKDVPKEALDYVFSVFSAAVICEDPKLFGFSCDCPAFEKTESPAE